MKNKAKIREQLEKELLADPKFAPLVLAEKKRRDELKSQESQNEFLASMLKTLDLSLQKFSEGSLAKSPADLMVKNSESINLIAEALAVVVKGLTEKDQTYEYLKDIRGAITELAQKELPTPVVNVGSPKVEVKPPEVPAPVVIDKTHIIQETKHAEEANGMLMKIAALLSRKLPTAFRITNTDPEDAVPVKLVDAKGKNFYNAIMQAIAASGGGGGSSPSSYGDSGTATISVTDTPQALSATPIDCKGVYVSAYYGNSGVVWVGPGTISSTSGSEKGKSLFGNQGVWFPINDISKIKISGTANDRVTFFYLT